jgi:hypothetical protein
MADELHKQIIHKWLQKRKRLNLRNEIQPLLLINYLFFTSFSSMTVFSSVSKVN